MGEFLANNALFLVLAIALLCWFGILAFLFRLDKRISRLEQTHHNEQIGKQ